MYDLGLKLKKLREEKNLTQKQVAERIHMDTSTISSYESGTIVPSIEALLALARLYNVSTDYLLGVDNRPMMYLDGLTPKQRNLIQKFLDEFRGR